MIKDKIEQDIAQAFKSLKLDAKQGFAVEEQPNPQFGEYSSNAALLNAKNNTTTPRELAEKLAQTLNATGDYGLVDIAGPGFLNFRLSKKLYQSALAEILKQGKNYGSASFGNGRKVLIEFISANPTGPLNIVSARAAAFGDSLFRLLEFTGFKPVREFYINDAGNQVDILAESLELRYREIHGEILREFPLEAYHGEYVKDLAAKLNAIEGVKLLHLSEKERLTRMKNFALEEINRMQVESLQNFKVQFDSWISEKALRKQGIVQEVMSYLSEADCTFEKDDAVWFSSSRFGDEKDRVLMKSDGSYTYLVPDIGYHMTKYQRGFDAIIDVLGPDHHGYVPRLLAAMEALGYDRNKMEVIYLQQVNLFEEGEKVKMSKRAGKIVTMQDLLDEVGCDAARFFFVERKPSAHLNFDLELALSQSNENPVYYCQYAHARICSILRKATKAKMGRPKLDNLVHLDGDDDVTVIKKLGEFPEMLIAAAQSREPHRIAAWVVELAGEFHRYYQKNTVLDESNPAVSEARLQLITAIRNTMAIALNLVGVTAPEKM